MKLLPEDGSLCERCHKGIVHWHAGGATCAWCGITDRGAGLKAFCNIPNGSIFMLPDYYPASTHYQHGEVIMVKAMREKDFPSGRQHHNNNCYHLDNPDLQGYCGPLADVVPLQPIGGLLK